MSIKLRPNDRDQKSIEWMSFYPSTDEVARALATDCLAEFAFKGICFDRPNSDDSIVFLGQYGFPNAD